MILAACGNDCELCPRHLPKTDGELRHTAELWHKIGYRDHIVSNDEISCAGCKAGNWCRYDMIGCVSAKGLSNCGECVDYPCERITDCFAATEKFVPQCRAACTDEEFETLRRAFFEKKTNLDRVKREG